MKDELLFSQKNENENRAMISATTATATPKGGLVFNSVIFHCDSLFWGRKIKPRVVHSVIQLKIMLNYLNM
ncbi:MAG: hypothetical protein HDS89_08580 [Bacteroidales bacterium]|nr:hypothetical protein [Bacteroidales bacterium]